MNSDSDRELPPLYLHESTIAKMIMRKALRWVLLLLFSTPALAAGTCEQVFARDYEIAGIKRSLFVKDNVVKLVEDTGLERHYYLDGHIHDLNDKFIHLNLRPTPVFTIAYAKYGLVATGLTGLMEINVHTGEPKHYRLYDAFNYYGLRALEYEAVFTGNINSRDCTMIVTSPHWDADSEFHVLISDKESGEKIIDYPVPRTYTAFTKIKSISNDGRSLRFVRQLDHPDDIEYMHQMLGSDAKVGNTLILDLSNMSVREISPLRAIPKN